MISAARFPQTKFRQDRSIRCRNPSPNMKCGPKQQVSLIFFPQSDRKNSIRDFQEQGI
jgi:hypothetical protein